MRGIHKESDIHYMISSVTNPVLNAALKGGKLSHAYIVAEAETAQILAAAAVCASDGERPCGMCSHCQKAERGVHPDVLTIGRLPDKREIVVDQIRAVKEDVVVVPNESEKKAYIITGADSMNTAAQNALLRVLEEPPAHAIFVLTAENPAELLPTVRSRCVEIKGAAQPDGDNEAASRLAGEFFEALHCGAKEFTAFSFALDKLDRLELAAFVEAARSTAAEQMRGAALAADSERLEWYSRAETVLNHAAEFVARSVGAVHVSGLLCASLLDISGR